MITAKEAFTQSLVNAKPEYEELVWTFNALQRAAIAEGYTKQYIISKAGDAARDKFKTELCILGYSFDGWNKMQTKGMFDATIHWGS